MTNSIDTQTWPSTQKKKTNSSFDAFCVKLSTRRTPLRLIWAGRFSTCSLFPRSSSSSHCFPVPLPRPASPVFFLTRPASAVRRALPPSSRILLPPSLSAFSCGDPAPIRGRRPGKQPTDLFPVESSEASPIRSGGRCRDGCFFAGGHCFLVGVGVV